MGRWLRSLREEKNAKTLEARTDKTDKTSPDRVLSVLSVPSMGVSENFSEPATATIGQTTDGFVSFVSSPFERFEEIFSGRDWDEADWTYAIEERAGILEFDSGYDRADAERIAASEIAIMRRGTIH